MQKVAIAVHGGAGTILKSKMTPEKEKEYISALDTSIVLGHEALMKGASALEATEIAVVALEDSPLFNAGKGSVFCANGLHEMDASIMEGKGLQAGAVSRIGAVKNPISVARAVLEKSEHVMLSGEGALEFAKDNKFVMKEESYFFDQFRYDQWQEIKDTDGFQLDHSDLKESKFGTVGAVALDLNGNIAAATSTGGMTNKKFGRIGDSPIIGSGTYANNNTCAVSCTGSGEYFMRAVVAYDVSCLMEHKSMSLHEACEEVIHKRLMKINGDGGLIAVDVQGNLSLPFNTEGMYRASIDINQNKIVSIYK